jgi:hypothetical protein
VNLLFNEFDLLNVIKKAALDAINASQPCDFCFGKVTSTSPLKISIEQKMTLGAAQLVLTRNVTDFSTEVTMNWETESKSGGSGEPAFAAHNHSITGRKEILIHNDLKPGDEVVLMKQKGGQKYLVLDRLVKA